MRKQSKKEEQERIEEESKNIELTDYITLDKWENERGNYMLAADDFYLISLNYLDK